MNAEAAGAGLMWRERFDWMVRDNPWTTGVWGEVLEENGAVLGFAVEVPHPMWVDGTSTIGWMHMDVWLDPSVRGGFTGFQIYKRFMSRHRPEVCATTTANPTSAAVWDKLRGTPQPGSDTALLKVLRPLRVAVSAAEHRLRGSSRSLPLSWTPAALAPRRAGAHQSRSAGNLEDLSAFWRRQAPRYTLAVDRTEAWLRWRYAAQGPPAQLVELTDDHGAVRGFYAYRLTRRGNATSIRVATLLDLVVDPSDQRATTDLTADLVARTKQEGAALLEVKGGASNIRDAFQRAGFRARAGGEPAYWVRLPKAQKHLDQDAERWNLMPGDGDAGLH